MPDDTKEIRSARSHIAMYEESIAKRKAQLASGEHQVDEAQTRDWLAIEEAELEGWRRNLAAAKREANPI